MEKQTGPDGLINNGFYDELGEGWYSADNHPIALLRAENRARIPWVKKNLPPASSVLDIGCGAGLLTNALAKEGHSATGIDLSEESLKIAAVYDTTGSVRYLAANAYSLPFDDGTFDAAFALDVLEHVEEPQLLIAEAARTLKPGGLFFFHTFNRTFLSYMMVIKGVEWCVSNTPKNMHAYPLFLTPDELEEMCELHRMKVQSFVGLRPSLDAAFWKMLATRRVPKRFSFRFCRSLHTGYCGIARKHGNLLCH